MKKITKIFFIAFLFALGSEIVSQPITWQRVYGGPQPEYGKYGIQTFDGGYIIVNRKQGFGAGINILKLDCYGNAIFSKSIDSTGIIGTCIKQLEDSGFIITGTGNGRGKLFRTDKNGNIIWEKVYTINNEESSFRRIDIVNNNNYIICGSISFPIKAYFLNIDSSGKVLWQNTFSNSTSFTLAYDICISSSFYYTTGVTIINGFPKTLIGKINYNGDFIWFKNYGIESKGDAQSSNSIISESETELYLTGPYSHFYSTEAHFTKIDSAGNIIFQNVLPQTNESNGMCKTISGKYAITGGILTTSDDILFLLLDKNGEVISRKLFNSFEIEGDFSESIIETRDKGFLITGFTSFLNTSQLDYNIYVIKTDSLGNSLVSIKNISSELAPSFKLYQNYPNPFNPTTTISYKLPKGGLVKIKIFDITGKEILTLVNELKQAGRYEVEFNGSNLSGGIYFCRIQTDEFIETKRMMLLK